MHLSCVGRAGWFGSPAGGYVSQYLQFDEALEAAHQQQLWHGCQQRLNELDSPHDASTPEQRVAYLVYRYWCETLDGGHLEYLAADALLYLEETKAALQQVGAGQQRAILMQAAECYLSRSRDSAYALQDLLSAVQEEEFAPHDASLYACVPTLETCLRRYALQHPLAVSDRSTPAH